VRLCEVAETLNVSDIKKRKSVPDGREAKYVPMLVETGSHVVASCLLFPPVSTFQNSSAAINIDGIVFESPPWTKFSTSRPATRAEPYRYREDSCSGAGRLASRRCLTWRAYRLPPPSKIASRPDTAWRLEFKPSSTR
jgi:hypothetical protein